MLQYSTVSSVRGPDLVEPMLASARDTFDSGAVITSGIGALMMVIAAVIARRTLRGAADETTLTGV